MPVERARGAAHDLTETETGRLQSFSDAVFAVAITLLVLTLMVPTLPGPPSQWDAGALAMKLGGEWPSYLAFVTSFGTILVMWINHHAIVKLVRRADTLFVFANGFHLMHVTVVPFITALVARYLTTPAASTACAIYAGVFAVGNLVFNGLWRVGAHERRLLHPSVPQTRVDQLTKSYLAGFPIYLVATALAFWNPYVSIGLCCCLWVVWAVTGYERLAEDGDSPPPEDPRQQREERV
jgi:uncharacterized membrane protein